MKRSIKILLFCLSSLTLISWDRVTKDLAKEHLQNKEAISYFHDTFRLQYAENTGAAMSMGDGLSKTMSFWLLSILPLLFLIVLFSYAIKHSGEMRFPKMFSFALIFAGGMGNVIDRILFDRHVTDFMNMGINNFRTGIFNFADVCVSFGAVGLLIFYKDQQKERSLTTNNPA